MSTKCCINPFNQTAKVKQQENVVYLTPHTVLVRSAPPP